MFQGRLFEEPPPASTLCLLASTLIEPRCPGSSGAASAASVWGWKTPQGSCTCAESHIWGMWGCICSSSLTDTFSSAIKSRLRKHIAFDWTGSSLEWEINKSLSSCSVCSASDCKGHLTTFYHSGSFIQKRTFDRPLLSEQDSLSIMTVHFAHLSRCPHLYFCFQRGMLITINYFDSRQTCNIPLQ